METVNVNDQQFRGYQTLDEFIIESGHDLPIMDSERYVSYSVNDLYPQWQEEAHCRGVGHAYYFGDEERQPTMSIKQVRNAAKLCDVCPVFDECLRHALTVREEYGVWAGTSGRARRRLFAMLDNGEASVEQVIEVVANERRGRPASLLYREQAGDGVQHEAAGDVAL